MDHLLINMADDAPSGENLEYEKVYTDLMLVAQPVGERQAGQEILAAEEPDHKQVITRALAVLEQSHDLRVAVILAQSQLRLNGLEGFVPVLGYIRGLLEQFWDSCHPQLDPDDDDDPTMRINSVLALGDGDTMLRALRLVPLTRSQTFGQFNLRDLMIADGELTLPDGAPGGPDGGTVGAAFRTTDADWLRAQLDLARQSLDHVVAINRVFDEQTPGRGPQLDPLIKILRRIVARLGEEVGADPDDAGSDDAAQTFEPAAGGGAPRGAGGAPGTIASRRDVDQMLGRILDYYAEYEPSSPLPILLRRARRLIGADFLEIIRDLAPEGLSDVNKVAGTTEDD